MPTPLYLSHHLKSSALATCNHWLFLFFTFIRREAGNPIYNQLWDSYLPSISSHLFSSLSHPSTSSFILSFKKALNEAQKRQLYLDTDCRQWGSLGREKEACDQWGETYLLTAMKQCLLDALSTEPTVPADAPGSTLHLDSVREWHAWQHLLQGVCCLQDCLLGLGI